MLSKFVGHPNILKIVHNTFLLTESNYFNMLQMLDKGHVYYELMINEFTKWLCVATGL